MAEILIQLYLSFFKIGMFGFGGGYAMISLIQDELVSQKWLQVNEFIDIIAIAQMTPGPIAINSGTFVGFKMSSIWGSLIATIAVVTPSFLMVLILARFFNKIKDSDYVKKILSYLRPTVIALILIAAITIARTGIADFKGVLITIAVVFIMLKTNLHPIMIILLAGLSGAIIY
ncbi:MAG: chromate transporter [Bacillota bacterium]